MTPLQPLEAKVRSRRPLRRSRRRSARRRRSQDHLLVNRVEETVNNPVPASDHLVRFPGQKGDRSRNGEEWVEILTSPKDPHTITA
jgi:hypothetical protein